jgi:two-component system sensor histidine kinase MprB
MTITRRLALAAAAAVAVAIALASLGAYIAVRSKLLDEVDSTLRKRAETIQRLAPEAATLAGAPRANRGPHGQPLPPPPRDAKRFGGAVGDVQLVSPEGVARKPPGQSGASLPIGSVTRAVAAGRQGTTIEDETVDGNRLRVLSAPLHKGGAVEVALPLSEVDSTLRGLVVLLAAITAGGIALAALLGLLVARTSLRPIRRFTQRTEEIAGQRELLGQRLPASGEDELGRLARSYNTTLDALEQSVESQRQLVSDASHELRTPLASLRTNLELLMRREQLSQSELGELSGDLVEQVDELTRLVEEIVELARSGEQPQHFEELPLADVVAAALGQMAPHAQAQDVSFAAELAGGGIVRCEPDRLARAVRNLLENAVKWSPPGGEVELRLDGGLLSIADHGPGIDPEDLPHIFERFYRARDSRRMPGSGLGLAIVRQIADAHGASVSAAAASGGGTVMRMQLPIVSTKQPVPSDDEPTPARAPMSG